MKPLIVLLTAFLLSAIALILITGNYQLAFAGRIAMAVMLLFTAMGHFIYTKGMGMMLPGMVPFKTQLVHLTGAIEIIFAIGLLSPYPKTTGLLLIAFLLLVIPANIYAAFKHVDYQAANFKGSGLAYLRFRVPLQVFFIAWIYLSAIKC